MQRIAKSIVWFCLCAIPFVALYVASGWSADVISGNSSGLYFPFISGKNILFRFLVEIAFAGWVLVAISDSAYRINLRKSPLTIAYGIFILVILIADIFGVDPAKSIWSNYERMEGFVGHVHFFAYFFVLTAMMRNLKDWHRLLKCFYASNILVLLWALGQWLGAPAYFFAKHFPEAATWFTSRFPVHMSENRLDATIGNSAYFAIFCLLFMGLYALSWMQTEKTKRTWPYPVMIVLNLIALYYSGTRGTVIGLFVGLLVTLGLMVFRWADSRKETIGVLLATFLYMVYLAAGLFVDNALLAQFSTFSYIYAAVLVIVMLSIFLRFKGDRVRRFGAGIFLAIIAVVLLFQGVKNVDFVKSSPTLQRLASISPTDITASSRLSIWKISFEAWKERPLLGYGQDNFSHIYARKFVAAEMWNIEPWYDRSHNVFFDWLVAGGILGLVSYLSLYAVALWLLWKKGNHVPLREKALLSGLLAGYFVHNIFVFDNLTSYILFFTLLAYIVMRTSNIHEPEHHKALVNEEQLRLLWAPLALVALVAVAYYINYRPLAVNRLLVRGINIAGLIQNEGMTFPQAAQSSLAAFQKAISYNTLGVEETREQFLQSGVKLSQIQIPNELSQEDKQAAIGAITDFEKGVQEDIQASYPQYKDNVRMLSLYGMYYNGIGDPVTGETVLTEAHTLAPNKQLISHDLIKAYLMQGKNAQAYALARETYASAPAYLESQKWFLISAAYAKSFKEAQAMLAQDGYQIALDADVIGALVNTGQIPLAIQLLNDLKKTNPLYASQIDAYIKQLLTIPKK